MLKNLKYLLLLLGLLWIPSAAKAAGGVCPTGVNYLSEPSDSLTTLAGLGVTNCYFVSSAGSDSNPGTSEASPWAHAPGMYGCASNCLTVYNAGVTAGTGLIFRGGDTWHYGNGTTTSTGLPWTCGYPKACSGTATNPVYIGFDKAWYIGGSWARPIFNMDNPLSTSTVSSCTYDDGVMTGALNHEPVFLYDTNYIILDDFEFKGYCWNLSSGTYIYEVGNSIQLDRLYFHGWTYVNQVGASCSGGFCDTSHMITGSGSAATFAFDTFDGTDSSPDSGFALYAQNAQDVHGGVFRHLSNGMVGGPIHTFHDNLAEDLTLSYDGTTHANVFEFLSAYAGNNTYYNNVIRNTSNDGGIKFWLRTGTQTATDYVYNNVIFGNVNSNCFLYAQAVASTTTNTVNFFNNTFDQCTVTTNGNSVTHPFYGTLNFENNHFIGYSAQNLGATWSNGSGTYAGDATAADLGGQIYQTEVTANGQGYLPVTNYMPTNGFGATIGAGNNLTGSCGTAGAALCKDTSLGNTRAPAARPATGNWNTGAYQFAGLPIVVTPVISPVSGVHGTPITITLTDSTPGAYICWTANGTTPIPNGSGGCSNGSLYSAPFSQSVPSVVQAVAGASGYSNSATASATYTLAAVPVITSASTASGTVGVAFTYQITATNSPTNYSASGLPSGLSVNTSTGLISGTPTTPGTSSATVGATNSSGTGTAPLTITISATVTNGPCTISVTFLGP